MEFVSLEDGIDVNGRTVYTIVDGFKLIKSVPMRILLEKDIGARNDEGKLEISANAWYPQQAWLDAFKEIAERMGDPVLHQIGIKIPENAQFPEWVVDIDSAVKSINIAYHMNHQKNGNVMFNPETGEMLDGIGHYGFERIENENKIISVCNNPYPCHFDRGIITAMAKKFEKNALVEHDDSKPCRKNGEDSCTYIITW